MMSQSDAKLQLFGACAEVLWIVGGYKLNSDRPNVAREPGSFHRALIEAMLKADRSNLAVLMQGFPHLSAAVAIYKNEGPDALEALARYGEGAR